MKTTYLKGIKQAEILFMECKQWQWPVERWNLNNEMLYSDTMNHFSPGNVCFQTTREVWEALEIFDLDYRIIDNRNVQSFLQGDQIMDNSKRGDYMYINRIWKIIVLLLYRDHGTPCFYDQTWRIWYLPKSRPVVHSHGKINRSSKSRVICSIIKQKIVYYKSNWSLLCKNTSY